jgi:predicted transcriptional regulator
MNRRTSKIKITPDEFEEMYQTKTMSQIAAELGVSYPTICSWKKTHLRGNIVCRGRRSLDNFKCVIKVCDIIHEEPGISLDRISEKASIPPDITREYIGELYKLGEIAITVDQRYYPVIKDGDELEPTP